VTSAEARRRKRTVGIARSLGMLAALIGLTVIFALQNRDPQVVKIEMATALDALYRPLAVTDAYAPDQPFYASVQVRGYRGDAPLVARWRSPNMEPVLTPFEGDARGEGFVGFALSNEVDWPEGAYFVDILYGDMVLATTEFRVEDK
jgi:hypothetical protein